MDFDNKFPTCPYPGEVTRVTSVDVELQKVKQESLQIIRDEIAGLSIQSRRRIESALKLYTNPKI